MATQLFMVIYNDLSPKLEAYVKKRQYEKESYEIELFPKKQILV